MSNSASLRNQTTPAKKSKRREAEQPISIADIFRSPMLQRPGVALPSDERALQIVREMARADVPDIIVVQSAIPQEGVPQHGEAYYGVDDSCHGGVPQQGLPQLTLPDPGVNEEKESPGWGTPFSGTPEVKLKRWNTFQEANTPGEQRIYEALWREGKPEDDSQPFKTLTIGAKRLERITGMKADNARRNIAGMVAKLAVEDYGLDPNPGRGRRYKIWSAGETLRRRNEQGLTHVARLRNGVILVHPGLSSIGTPSRDTLTFDRSTPFRGSLAAGSIPGNPTLGISQQPELTVHSAGSAHPDIVAAVVRVMKDCDDATAIRLVEETTRARPGIPIPVIVNLIEMKGPAIRKRQVDPLRELVTAVAAAAAGVTGEHLVQAWRLTEQRRRVLNQLGSKSELS